MKSVIRIPLATTAEQAEKLLELQETFARVCNAITPLSQKTRCWNRVALHHMVYKSLRDQFPTVGSQMICNAIYAVSRASRLVFQHPQSPFCLAKLGDKSLPLLQFAAGCPVYFDRHTLSLKQGQLSLYTLDGRIHFQAILNAEIEAGFLAKKLREISLARNLADVFELTFVFSDELDEPDGSEASVAPEIGRVPEYLLIEEMT
jgi:hypothetical protein